MGNLCNLWSPTHLLKCSPCLHLSSKTLPTFPHHLNLVFSTKISSLVIEDILALIKKWLNSSCQEKSSPQTRSIRNSWTHSTLKSQILFKNPALCCFFVFFFLQWICLKLFVHPWRITPSWGCLHRGAPALSHSSCACCWAAPLSRAQAALSASPDATGCARRHCLSWICVWTHCLCRMSSSRVPAPCLRAEGQGKSHILLSWYNSILKEQNPELCAWPAWLRMSAGEATGFLMGFS